MRARMTSGGRLNVRHNLRLVSAARVRLTRGHDESGNIARPSAYYYAFHRPRLQSCVHGSARFDNSESGRDA